MNVPILRQEVMIAPYTTYGIGGPADYFIEANSVDDLVAAVVWARQNQHDYFVLGKGSNILMSDEGYRGLVILNTANKCVFEASKVEQKTVLIAESGAVVEDIIQQTASLGLSGFEHYAGIPSTVGGGMWQNLHFLSPDRSRTLFMADIVASARVLMSDNTVQDVGADFFQFGYDDSILQHQDIVVLDVTFRLETKASQDIYRQIDQNLAWRRQRQPQLKDWPSCGSVFKQIEGVGAGRLIDQAGLKGKWLGGAEISPIHANFIVNTGQATAQDVLDLARLAQAEVKQQTGYDLQMEVKLVGVFD